MQTALAGNTGLQTLMAEGLRIYGIRPMPTTLGQQMLRAANPDDLIGRLIERHTVNGYTSHAELCKTLEDNLRCLHRHARKSEPTGRVDAWLEVDGTSYPVQFDEAADSWPTAAIVAVWINSAWHDPRSVLSFRVCEALDRAADAWRPEQ